MTGGAALPAPRLELTPAFLRRPVRHRVEAMMDLAAQTCGLGLQRFGDDDGDARVRQMRQLAAWLMRKRADVTTFDTAAALGVDPQFVTATLFLLSARFARSGARIDGPIAEQAARVAALLEPAQAALAAQPLALAFIFDLVASEFRMSHAEMAAAGRRREPTRARQSFAWLASIATTASDKEIGRLINRDRSSVNWAIASMSGLPGMLGLRDDVLAALAGKAPVADALRILVRRIELITRSPATALERLNP